MSVRPLDHTMTPFGVPILSAPDLMAMAIVRPSDVVQGLIASGSKVVFAGSPKSNKSWMMLHLGICVSLGIPWLGFATHTGTVLYLNLELPDWAAQERLVALCAQLELAPESLTRFFILNLRGVKVERQSLKPKLMTTIGPQDKVSLVIVDSTYKLHDDDAQLPYDDPTELLEDVGAFCQESGAALIMVNHFAKGGTQKKSSMDRVFGSGVWLRDADGLLTITRKSNSDNFAFESDLRLHPPIENFIVSWVHPLMVRLDASLASMVKARQPGASGLDENLLLPLIPPSGIARGELLQLVAEQFKISAATLDRKISLLVEQGKVTRNQGKICLASSPSPARPGQEPLLIAPHHHSPLGGDDEERGGRIE
jgi:hypothetical protein